MPDQLLTERSLVESLIKQRRLSNTTLSYYNSNYGEAVKPLLERFYNELNRNSEAIISVNPRDICNKSLSTAYIILNRATLFLADWPDDDTNEYRKMRDSIIMRKNPEKNTIEIRKRFGELYNQVAEIKVGDMEIASRDDEYNQGANAIAWQNNLDNFIETSKSGERLEMTELCLSVDDINHIIALMSGTGNGFEVVTCNRTTVIVKRV